MRNRSAKWLVAMGALAALGGANAASAAPLAYVGELALVISGFDPIAVPGAGFAVVEPRAGDPDHLATLRLEASQFGATGLIVPITDPLARPIYGVVATARNAPGGFAEQGGGALGGVLPLVGSTKVCLFGSCDGGALANLTVPISVVGAGGVVTAAGAVNVTVVGAPWTTGTVAIGTITTRGFAQGPSDASSTLQPSGTVRLVTPIYISTSLSASSVVPAFGYLTLHFVPEPGTLLLVGSGLVALVGAGSRRLRSRP